MMICAIMQPTYLPWMGYFDLIDQVDRFVFLDNVKLEKSDWHVRNRIKSPNGELYLTVNVTMPKGRMETFINEAVIEYRRPWPRKHLTSIQCNYKKARWYKEIYPFFEELLLKKYERLSDLNIVIIKAISRRLGIEVEYFVSSEMGELKGVKDERLVDICQKLGCDQYLSPQGSATYLEKNRPGGKLVEQGIELFYQNFEHPEYEQLHGGFISHLSMVDLLFNNGFEKTHDLIRQGRRDKYDYLSFRTNMMAGTQR